MSKDKCMDVRMTQCVWCGEPKAIAIGKKLIDCENKYDNKFIFDNYEPCDECMEKWNKGFVLIEAQEKPVKDGQPPMQEGIYPTGNMWVIDKESAGLVLNEEIVNGGICFIQKEMAERLGLYGENNE